MLSLAGFFVCFYCNCLAVQEIAEAYQLKEHVPPRNISQKDQQPLTRVTCFLKYL